MDQCVAECLIMRMVLNFKDLYASERCSIKSKQHPLGRLHVLCVLLLL